MHTIRFSPHIHIGSTEGLAAFAKGAGAVATGRHAVTVADPVNRPLSFGCFLVPTAASPLIATAKRVERLGLDYVGIQDHPYQRNFADTWSLMAMIAAMTTTLRIFPDVANLPLRPPAVMAKAAATIDLLSGGRFE